MRTKKIKRNHNYDFFKVSKRSIIRLNKQDTNEESEEESDENDFSKLELIVPKKINILEIIKASKPIPSASYVNLFRKSNTCTDYNVYMIDKYNNDVYYNDLLTSPKEDSVFLKINKFLKGIEYKTFENNKTLKEVDLSCDSIEVIKQKAFNYCLNLSKVKLGNNIIVLEDYCFANTSHLEYLYLEKSMKLKSIGKCCFFNSNLKNIDLPNNVEIIGNSCFENSKLEYINYPTIIFCDIIPQRCFKNTQLKNMYIPNNVKIIRGEAFMDCKKLKTIIVSKNIELIEKRSFRNLHDDYEIILLKNENKKRKRGCYIYIDLGAFDIPTKEVEDYVEKYITSSNIIIRKTGISIQMEL